MDLRQFSSGIHIVNGDSPAGLLKHALHLSPDQLLINEDAISIGPAPPTNDLSAWRKTRERYLDSVYLHWPDFSFDGYADRGLLLNAERLRHEPLVFVWVACGLSEQLLLSWVVFLFDRLEVETSKLRVIQFETQPSNWRIWGIGVLSPDKIRNLCPEPRVLDSDELEELRRVWSVYTSSDPASLKRYIEGASPLPLLHRAVSHLVYRYPGLRSGLSGWDERLLRYTMAKGPDAVWVVGDTLAWGMDETLDSVSDFYLFRRLIGLGDAALNSPLISITGNSRTMRGCEVRLTNFGEKVLSGEANHVRRTGSTTGSVACTWMRRGPSRIVRAIPLFSDAVPH